MNSALLSRCRVFVLQKLSNESVVQILKRAIEDKQLGISDALPSSLHLKVNDDAVTYLADQASGDARIALNSLEMAVKIALQHTNVDNSETIVHITLKTVTEEFRKSHVLYDRAGDNHYDCISALHKSIRGSDENATLYWMARMLAGGENPLYVARRFIRIASEDIGLADPNALNNAVSTFQACQFIGMPECEVNLAHCAVYLARAPKSIEVYAAWKKTKAFVASQTTCHEVPMHLRNAPTTLMKNRGFGYGTF